MYDKGLGVPQDYAQAIEWFRKAADAGRTARDGQPGRHVSARLRRGAGHAAGRWRGTSAGAEAGSPHAMNNLAVLYQNGADGVSEDEPQAAHWFRKAAEAGMVAPAMYNLGVIVRDGPRRAGR